jgi:hypothetical protein
MALTHLKADLFDQIADATRHATDQAQIHIVGEIKGLIPELMETLTPEGPYAYTILPEVHPDGSVRLPTITTSEGIRECYHMVRGASELLSVSALTEIRGTWYTFQDSISRVERRDSGKRGASQTAAIFPSGKGSGITGELVWLRKPRSALGGPIPASDAEPLAEMYVREQVFQLHEQYVDAFRRGDVEGVLATFNDGIASATRDYVNDTGTIGELQGKAAHRAYYEALFDRYEILSVESWDRVAEEWYVFAELRVTAVRRGGAASDRVAFNRAEFFVPANDGRFIARIGHGTDPV